MPAGFSGVQDYPAFADRLHHRGLDEKTIRDIFWNNPLRVMKNCRM
jgi:microsomal dipeptidase-like Zn-dependent dipeptidase